MQQQAQAAQVPGHTEKQRMVVEEATAQRMDLLQSRFSSQQKPAQELQAQQTALQQKLWEQEKAEKAAHLALEAQQQRLASLRQELQQQDAMQGGAFSRQPVGLRGQSLPSSPDGQQVYKRARIGALSGGGHFEGPVKSGKWLEAPVTPGQLFRESLTPRSMTPTSPAEVLQPEQPAGVAQAAAPWRAAAGGEARLPEAIPAQPLQGGNFPFQPEVQPEVSPALAQTASPAQHSSLSAMSPSQMGQLGHAELAQAWGFLYRMCRDGEKKKVPQEILDAWRSGGAARNKLLQTFVKRCFQPEEDYAANRTRQFSCAFLPPAQ
ncbi:unnamed protein product [Durusdinium trenchii]|uniref:Uncharacterized protein n=1 Tax=Durusdinium trenchii TaxID=1381693 RepID=A0ABP0KBD4_9DINO